MNNVIRNTRITAGVLVFLTFFHVGIADDPTGIGSWSQVGSGWPDDPTGIEAIHLSLLPSNQLITWGVTNW